VEDVVRGGGLAEGTLTVLLGQQADWLGTEQPSPDCGRPYTMGRQERPVCSTAGL
jgi:hypothetical protein